MTCLDVVLGAGFGVFRGSGQCWVLVLGFGSTKGSAGC